MPSETKKPSKRGPKPGTPQRGGVEKGYKQALTLDREAAKQVLRDEVLANLKPLLRAAIKSGTGVDHFMLRDTETGQFRRLIEASEIEAALNHPDAAEGSTYWVHTKDPNIQAIADLLNRAIGKPVEAVQVDAHVETRISWDTGSD